MQQSDLEKALDDSRAENTRLQQELGQLTRQVQSAAHLQGAQQELQACKQELQLRDSRSEQQLSKLDQANQLIHTNQLLFAECQTERDTLRAECNSLATEIERMNQLQKGEAASAKQEEQQRKQHEILFEECRAERDRLETECSTLRAEVEVLSGQQKSLRQKWSAEQDNDHRAQQQQLASQLQDSQYHLDLSRSEKDVLERQCKLQLHELEQLKLSLADVRSKQDTLAAAAAASVINGELRQCQKERDHYMNLYESINECRDKSRW